MGTLLHSCAEVRELIELFGEVSDGVTPGIHVLDGDPRASRGSGGVRSNSVGISRDFACLGDYNS